MGVQVLRGFHTEVAQKGVVPGIEAIFGRSISGIGRAKAKSDRSEAPDAGSCTHDDYDTAEVRGVAGSRVYQGVTTV
jgi:hypothetical protein